MGRIGTWKLHLRVLKRETYALLLACRDERTPWYAKLMAAVVVAYSFSPINRIPLSKSALAWAHLGPTRK